MTEKGTALQAAACVVRCVSFLLACYFLLSASSALAQIPDFEPQAYPLPPDMSGVHFYLITVDVGDKVWDNFGHTALRMYDENSATDLIFNWGVFDVSGGVVPFAWNFFKGIMNYQLQASAPGLEFDMYRASIRSLFPASTPLSLLDQF